MKLFKTLLAKVSAKALQPEANVPAMAKLPSEFETIVAGMTPQKLSAVLRGAATGEATEFFRLAEEMEELDPHYRSVLGTRKLALQGLEFEVEGDGAAADFAREIVAAPPFRGLVTDLTDALGKGYSAVQIEWDTAGNQWRPEAYTWWEPELFAWDRAAHALAERLPDGKTAPLTPFAFAVHVPKLKSGHPVRGALARIAAWSFLFKNYTLKDWVRFTEVYGMPVRVGKHDPSATEEDKRKLLRALQSLGADAAAIMPTTMMVEFVQTASGTAAQGPVFGELAKFCDASVSKAVLGQTMTTEDGSSKAQAEVHNDVRLDILKADAAALEETINRDVIMPAIAFNFGEQKIYPRFTLPVPEPEDLKLFTESVTAFMDRGLAVSTAQIREKFNLDEPRDADDALTGRAAAAADGEAAKPGAKPKAKAKTEKASLHPAGCQCGCGVTLAAAREGDSLDALVEAALAKAGPGYEAMIDPVIALLSEATDYDDFAAKLAQAHGMLDAGGVIKALGNAAFKARGLGDATDDPAA